MAAHAKIHGSHVIIRCQDDIPDDETLYEAACLAAYYSQARDGGKVPVDYALAKFLLVTLLRVISQFLSHKRV